MSQSTESIMGRVPALSALTLSGKDCLAFSQRICANDVTLLAVGDWQWNCILSAQGRVLTLFRLWRRSEECLTLVLPEFARDATNALLRRYLLRAKLVLANDDGIVIGGSSAVARPEAMVMQAHDGSWLGLSLSTAEDVAEYADVSTQWQARDLAQGVPWLDPDASATFTPQALSLDRLGAFSVRKGCYPGQEIVARMHFLGQNKRALQRFAAGQSVALGAPLCSAGPAEQVLGTTVMVAPANEGSEILAVVQLAAQESPLFAGSARDVPLRALPFEAASLAVGLSPLAKA